MENEKKSKIKSCRFVSEWAGQNGIVYYHEIELDNGDRGQIGTKDRLPDKLGVGQELSYTIESTSRGNKIKAVSAGAPGFKGKPQRDPKEQMISFSMSYCKDLVVAGKLDIKDLEIGTTRIYNIMKKLYES
jgi:hypothetical protein